MPRPQIIFNPVHSPRHWPRGHWLNSSGTAWTDFVAIPAIDIFIHRTGANEWIAESNTEIGPIAVGVTPEEAFYESLQFLEESETIPSWDWDRVNFPLFQHPFFNGLDKLRMLYEVAQAAMTIDTAFNPTTQDIP